MALEFDHGPAVEPLVRNDLGAVQVRLSPHAIPVVLGLASREPCHRISCQAVLTSRSGKDLGVRNCHHVANLGYT